MSQNAGTQKENIASIVYLTIKQKWAYIFVLFILAIILVVQITACIVKFFNYPTYIETRIVPQDEALFPALTICPVADGYKEDVLQVTKQCYLTLNEMLLLIVMCRC